MADVDAARIPRWSLRTGATLNRIFRRFGQDDRTRSPWFYSCSDGPAAGRFDLPSPRGTCYFASTPVGAWLEVFRGARLVDPNDVRRRQLATATRSGAPLALADLTSAPAAAAAAAGVTLDLVATDDYSQPQALAAALDRRGEAGVRALLRHDPSGLSRTVALFGNAGMPSRQFGWQVTRSSLWRDAGLMRDLAAIGIHVADIPHDVPIDSPS